MSSWLKHSLNILDPCILIKIFFIKFVVSHEKLYYSRHPNILSDRHLTILHNFFTNLFSYLQYNFSSIRLSNTLSKYSNDIISKHSMFIISSVEFIVCQHKKYLMMKIFLSYLYTFYHQSSLNKWFTIFFKCFGIELMH